ncbi:PH domain-containing protein [Nocardioides sp. JQ2195]|uniref:PH domain-containing protein n=1 Tax=Nocardioides sp. JQ2195 TaxID=2592334 RepID=UPI00143EE512|nr:PH domain-containing protein [Nocardioides sp. JQ2195]QIX27559.1 PH domain-containing protein [Nocardioides sp. JQ2195]
MSELELPHTYRPLGVRMAGIAGGVIVLVAVVAAWLLLSPEIRATFTLIERILALLLGAMMAACVHALVRAKVVVTERGLTIVNGYRTHEFEWAQVVAIHMPTGAPWATLDLSDGTTCSVLALQSTDGDRAVRAIRQIRTLLR